MTLSSIRIGDPETVTLDDTGRSVAYFCKRTPVNVDANVILDLKTAAAQLGDVNVRLCLHDGPDASFQDMIILQYSGRYYRPHKHPTKGVSYHIIEGSMGVFVFDEDAQVIDSCVLGPKGSLVYRVDANMYRGVMPLSKIVVYHEAKPGPFLRDGDSIFPPWAPDWDSLGQLPNYTNKLMKVLKEKWPDRLGDQDILKERA